MREGGRRRRTPSIECRRLGERVRTLRKERDWSLETLAEKAGLHVTYLSGIENGRRNPTLNVLSDLARAFDISLSDLLFGVNEGDKDVTPNSWTRG